jgi:hypothetical protein
MSEAWAERQRRTNSLVRRIATRVLDGKPDGDQLLGLCRLTWITDSYEGENPAYIRSTKIPALAEALGINLDGLTLSEAADEVAMATGDPEVAQLVRSHTGFTNFYKAYRNSARPWARQNRRALLDIFRQAFALASDEQGEALMSRVAALPLIPKANHPEQGMRPEFLVTPVCFALDGRVRFPIINGAERVQSLLRRIGAIDGTAVAKYRALVGLIGRGGISDAADLDQLGLVDQVDVLSPIDQPLRHLLQEQPEVGNDLPSKDESEVARLQQALTTEQRRLHNRMTNELRRLLANWTLLEGRSPDCRYDVLVRNYDEARNDLLVEVKSSSDVSQVRMAIGQVLSYWHHLKGDTDEAHTAILLPSRPDASIGELLSWLDIGLLWLEDGRLYTGSPWLAHLAALVGD